MSQQESETDPIERFRELFKAARAASPAIGAPMAGETPSDPMPKIEASPEIAEHAAKCDELGLYLIINNLQALLQQMARDIAKKSSDLELKAEIAWNAARAKESLLACVQQSTRFGVREPLEEIPSKAVGARKIRKLSGDYEAWFAWWHKAMSEIPQAGWKQISDMIDKGEDTSSIRPPGDWKKETGAIPREWLSERTRFGFVSSQESRKFENWESFRDSAKEGDELWRFANPNGGFEAGYALVKNGRPVAAIYEEPTS